MRAALKQQGSQKQGKQEQGNKSEKRLAFLSLIPVFGLIAHHFLPYVQFMADHVGAMMDYLHIRWS